MSSSSSQLESLKATPRAWAVPQENRHRYGCWTIEVLATNQPADLCLSDYQSAGETFPIHKKVSTVQNREFEDFFSAKIKRAIMQVLERSSIPLECPWSLHVLRLGFKGIQMECPIVVHLCVGQGYLSDNGACQLADEISAEISAAGWKGEKIYVDICQRMSVEDQLRGNESRVGKDLSENVSQLYEYSPPCPGFSVGPKDNSLCAGSLTGFIKHGNDVYGLTCSHVVNSSTNILGSSPYKYKDGQTKFTITMPAAADHETTKAEISRKRESATLELATSRERLELNLISPKHHEMLQKVESQREEFWSETKQIANGHDTCIGYVCATSGEDKSKQSHTGSLDWSIFHTSLVDAQNKYPAYWPFDRGSGFQLFGEDARHFVTTGLGQAFIKDARASLSLGPPYKPIQKDGPKAGDFYFKPASRSLGWTACQCNGIMTTMKDKNGVMTDEWCFVGLNSDEPVSEKGDSGAPLLDSQFRPTAMIWGGEENYKEFKDVTYATPLAIVLRDIERRMNWEKGSVIYL